VQKSVENWRSGPWCGEVEARQSMSAMDHLYAVRVKEIWAYMKTQDALFWLINIYLFMEYVRPQTLYPPIDVFPITKSLLVLILGVFLLRHNLALVKNPLNKLLFLFFVVILLSSVFALDPGVAYEKVPDFISWMVIFFLIINIVNTEKRFFVFMLAFLLYNFKMAQFSFINWVASGFGFIKIGSGGGPGWFQNSGEFGIQMCIFLSLSACFFFALKEYWPPWKKILFLFFPFIALTGTISSSSRGAVVGAVCVLFFMFLKGKHRFKGLVALGVILALVYFFLPDEQLGRLQSSGDDNSSTTRLVYWERGRELVSRFPFLGVGYNNWLVAQEKIFGLYNQELPHNIFIQCASELGYFGLMVFFLMIMYTFVNNFRTRKLALQHEREKKGVNMRFLYYMAQGLDGALVGYLVSGFFVTVLYYPYFWINLAMTVSLNAITRKQTEHMVHPLNQARISFSSANLLVRPTAKNRK
jgi:putative inorganic carbon (hco3(-)) transporter